MLRMVMFVLASTCVLGAGVARASGVRDPVFEVAPLKSATPHVAAMSEPDRLDGTSWRFVEVGGAPVPAAVTATMRLRNGRVAGRAGCNSYSATYRVAADGSAEFRPGMSTKMACVEPEGAARVEQGILTAFRGVARVEIRDGELVLRDSAGRMLARLVGSGAPGP